MKRRLIPALLIIALNGIILAGCYTDNEEDLYPSATCDLTNVTFSKTIKPIMDANCVSSGCHDAVTASSGYNLTGYAGVKLAVDDMKLLGAINHNSGFSAMPKNTQKLPDCALNQIKKWKDDGALNN